MGNYEASGLELHLLKEELGYRAFTSCASSESLAEFASDICDKNLYAFNMEKALLCKLLKCSKYRFVLTEQQDKVEKQFYSTLF